MKQVLQKSDKSDARQWYFRITKELICFETIAQAPVHSYSTRNSSTCAALALLVPESSCVRRMYCGLPNF